MHWHSRSRRIALVLQVTHFPYQSSLKVPWNTPEFLQVSLRKQKKDWWKVLAGRFYKTETPGYTGAQIKEVGIKKGISIARNRWKKVCLSQAFMCNTETNFLLCFDCVRSPCTLGQYQLCTFTDSQIGSVRITLQPNHSVGTCTKHY